MEQKELILCDTNIIIDFLRGDSKTISTLRLIGMQNIAISVVTAGEILFGALNKRELALIKNSLKSLNLQHIDETTGEVFMNLMANYSVSHRLSVPDGLIAATALVNDMSFFTRNKKDFKFIPNIRLYED